MEIYRRGSEAFDFKAFSGLYYYYRTRTRLGKRYSVKGFSMLVDESGFVYVKSGRNEKSRLYVGTLVWVNNRAGGKSVVAVLRKGDAYGGVLILERPQEIFRIGLRYVRGLHLSMNFYGDSIAGRVYLIKQSEKVDWEKFKRMRSPVCYFPEWESENNQVCWYVDENAGNDGESKGERINNSTLLEVLNLLCGQTNNFLAFREGELETRSNKAIECELQPPLFQGSYAEDILRAATAYWKGKDIKRFQESFKVAILCGGYSHIGHLKKWFVEDTGMYGCEKHLRAICAELRNDERGFRNEEQALRLEKIIDAMFGWSPSSP